MTPTDADAAGLEADRRLYFSATLITMDGSDTNAYGQACGSGHGYTEKTGWWNPDDDVWSVHPDRDHACPDRYPSAATSLPARWLADQLTQRLGPIDHFDDRRTFYSADELVRDSDTAPPRSVWGGAIQDPRAVSVGAQSLTAAGHAHGFTPDEIEAAAGLLGLAPAGPPAHRIAPQPSLSPPPRGFVAVHNTSQPPGPIHISDGATAPPAADRSGRRSR